MGATSRLEAARAIIAEGCGCDQQCHCLAGADVYCGCRKDAEKILALPEDHSDLIEVAENAYSSWASGEPIDCEMREIGRLLGMTSSPA